MLPVETPSRQSNRIWLWGPFVAVLCATFLTACGSETPTVWEVLARNVHALPESDLTAISRENGVDVKVLDEASGSLSSDSESLLGQWTRGFKETDQKKIIDDACKVKDSIEFLFATNDQERLKIVAAQFHAPLPVQQAIVGASDSMVSQEDSSGGFDATVALTCLAAGRG